MLLFSYCMVTCTLVAAGLVGASDYCLMEEFNASCRQPDEVVVIDEARYGRMAISRCVTGNYGHLGCYVDVRRLLHAKCSGRRSCRVRVPDDDLFATRPCPSDFTSYSKQPTAASEVNFDTGTMAAFFLQMGLIQSKIRSLGRD